VTTGRLVVLTGAGLSAESGLGTFRDAGGVWERYDLTRVATPEGYAADPALVLDFYQMRLEAARAAAPNPAHEALARLSERHPALTLVTQNVDGLLERAGARDALHMHGSLETARCAACAHRWQAARYGLDVPCPACGAHAIRPDVVWFGEMPLFMDEIGAALAEAADFVAIGTSGSVWPAAGFVAEARAAGARTLELNLAPSDIASEFDAGRYGPAGTLVPAWAEELIAKLAH
jgi:NAD-dependent deacetylase